jgi:hypothetical protein
LGITAGRYFSPFHKLSYTDHRFAADVEADRIVREAFMAQVRVQLDEQFTLLEIDPSIVWTHAPSPLHGNPVETAAGVDGARVGGKRARASGDQVASGDRSGDQAGGWELQAT